MSSEAFYSCCFVWVFTGCVAQARLESQSYCLSLPNAGIADRTSSVHWMLHRGRQTDTLALTAHLPAESARVQRLRNLPQCSRILRPTTGLDLGTEAFSLSPCRMGNSDFSRFPGVRDKVDMRLSRPPRLSFPGTPTKTQVRHTFFIFPSFNLE